MIVEVVICNELLLISLAFVFGFLTALTIWFTIMVRSDRT